MSRKKSFLTDIIKNRGMRVEFIVAENDAGQKNYFYIMCSELDFEKLDMKLKSGSTFDVKEYGTILIQGKGAEPPKGIEEELKTIINNR